jgi:drug/metabolite transporter (DMT)-like permease
MSAPAIMLALFAALSHATWNAFLRTGVDRLWSVTVMSLAMMVVAVPIALILPMPLASAWPYLILSGALQVGYSVFLVRAYAHGELGQVYPIVRGSVPLLVTLGGFALSDQKLPPVLLAGIVLVGLGIISLAFGKGHATAKSVLLALTTGLFIAGYATVDAAGVRLAGSALAYATWIYLVYGAFMLAAFMLMRGRLKVDRKSPETLKAVAGGMVSMVAYGAVVIALALAPVGPITALRETSVVFAAIIGRVFLKEKLTAKRVAACSIVAIGAFLIGSA